MQPELKDKLNIYHGLLRKWQTTINLVSDATLGDAWNRHFEDSYQLLDYIPEHARHLFDLGSGAGFPGMVLAMAHPSLKVHLIESDQKKCAFLKTVSRETDTPVTIHNERIEDVSRETIATLNIPDVITVRALAPLETLLDLARPWIQANRGLTMICPKGARADEEVTQAKKRYKFYLEIFPSKTDKSAQVIVLKDIVNYA